MFNVNDMLRSIIYIVLTAILPILVQYIVKYINMKVDELSVNIKNEKAKMYINAVVDAISIAVVSVNQTYVDSLKQDGKFDETSAFAAKSLAMMRAKELISKDTEKFINMMYGDFDKYLDNAIESYVRQAKLTVN